MRLASGTGPWDGFCCIHGEFEFIVGFLGHFFLKILLIYGAVLNPHAKMLAKNVGHASLQ